MGAARVVGGIVGVVVAVALVVVEGGEGEVEAEGWQNLDCRPCSTAIILRSRQLLDATNDADNEDDVLILSQPLSLSLSLLTLSSVP
jgi:hypothetical protein